MFLDLYYLCTCLSRGVVFLIFCHLCYVSSLMRSRTLLRLVFVLPTHQDLFAGRNSPIQMPYQNNVFCHELLVSFIQAIAHELSDLVFDPLIHNSGSLSDVLSPILAHQHVHATSWAHASTRARAHTHTHTHTRIRTHTHTHTHTLP